MSQMRAFWPVPLAQPVDRVLSPASTGPGSLRPAGSTEFVGKSPRTRPDVPRDGCDRCVCWRHRLGIFGPHASGSFGCPGGGVLRLSASVAPGVSGSEWYWPIARSASSGVGQCGGASQGEWTNDQWGGGGVGSDGLVIPELGVAPLEDSGTDLEDELPTPDGSPSTLMLVSR